MQSQRGGKRRAQRLERLLAMCGRLPECSCGVWGSHIAIRIRKKAFAYYLNDHHGDGMVVLCAKSIPPRQRELIEADPERYKVPAYLGPSGWVSYRLDLRSVDWTDVKELLEGAFLLAAPARLAASLR